MVRDPVQSVDRLFFARVLRMRGELCHVKFLWECHCCVQLLAPHRRVVEPLEMNDQHLGKAVDREVFLDADCLLAPRALVSAVYHLLWLYKLVKAVLYIDIAQEADGLARDLNTQVHEVVERVRLVAAAQAFESVDQLALEQVCHYGVVTLSGVLKPSFTLLIN